MAATLKQWPDRLSFVDFPFEIRHLVYDALNFPVSQQIYLGKTPTWSSSARGLLLACQTTNRDVAALIYGKNILNFVVGECRATRDFDRWSYTEFLVACIRPQTFALIKTLRISISVLLTKSTIQDLVPGLAAVSKLEVVVMPIGFFMWYEWKEECCHIEEVCRVIGKARSGLETVWDEKGDVRTMSMLQRVLGSEYPRKLGMDFFG